MGLIRSVSLSTQMFLTRHLLRLNRAPTSSERTIRSCMGSEAGRIGCSNVSRLAMDSPFQDPAVDPVLCSPYDPPDRHWQLDEFGRADRTHPPLDGRRDPLRISVPADVPPYGSQWRNLNHQTEQRTTNTQGIADQ